MSTTQGADLREYRVIPESEQFREALSLVRAGPLDAADAALREVCAYKTDSEVAQQSRSGDFGCHVLATVIIEQRPSAERPPAWFGSVYWFMGESLRAQQRTELARMMFEIGLQRDPTASEVWYSLGQLERDAGNLDPAREAFLRCTEVAAEDEHCHYWLGSILMQMGALESAEKALVTAEGLAPDDGRIWYRRGEIAMVREDYQSAILQFERARELGVDKKMIKEKLKACKAHVAPQSE